VEGLFETAIRWSPSNDPGWVSICPPRRWLLIVHLLTAHFRGGIRGIVELEILRQIERAMGGKMRIQSFVDLIIGTRCVTS
jgi:hypothetical protein